MHRRPLVVVKLGGSLMRGDGLRPVLDQIVEAAQVVRPVIVPGGGLFADAVREAQALLGFSDPLAHRLALDAMGHYAEVLAELRPGLVPVATAEAMLAAFERGDVPVWRPDGLRAGHARIPESWAVTSDSLAAHWAVEIGADALVLVKSAAGGEADLVDAAFAEFAARYGEEVRIVGRGEWGRLGAVLGGVVGACSVPAPGGAARSYP